MTIIKSNSLSALMPPKHKKQQSQPSRRSQHRSFDIIAIQEHLSRPDASNDVSQILQKMEVAYQENKQSINRSLLHMIVRLCGLSELIPKLTALSSNEQITEFLEELGQTEVKGLSMGNRLPLVISHRDKFYSEFHRRWSLFLTHLLSEDFPFFKQHSQTHFLEEMREWLGILSQSKLRNIRWAAVEVIHSLILCQLRQYTHFIVSKQARKAIEYSNDINLYLVGPLTKRMKDVDSKIRQTIHSIIKKVIVTMESDIQVQTIDDIFSPLLAQSSPKISEAGLQTILFLLKELKTPKRALTPFLWKYQKDFERISLMPNKVGMLALRVLVDTNKIDKSKQVLHPAHISKLFEFYSIENYTTGLKAAIEAFYGSIFADEEDLYKHRSLVMIEIVNLLNIYQSQVVKDNIMAQFFSYVSIPCQKILYMDGLFQTIMSGEYNYENEQVELKDREMRDWLEITINYAKFVKKNIEKYEALGNSKYDDVLESWKKIGVSYNGNVLGNIREIYHERIEGKSAYITKYYLEMISLLFLPIESAYEKYVQFLIQKMVLLFEIEQDPTILKGIVQIFYCLKGHSLAALTHHLTQPHSITPQTIIIKKICILTKFFYGEYVCKEFAEEIMSSFKKANHRNIKIEYILGLFLIHQWAIKQIMEQPIEEYRLSNYKYLQKQIISFLINIIGIGEVQEVKFACIHILCQIMSLVSSDSLSDIPSLYHEVSEDEILTIYKFLDREYGLPRVEQPSQQLDITIRMRNLDTLFINVEKGIKILFNMFENCTKIASMPSSLEVILGSLLQEQESFDPDQTILKLNQTMDTSVRYNSQFNSCAREKFATKYFIKLAERQNEASNAGSFIFWKLFQLVLHFNCSAEIKETLINRLSDIYLKRKLSSNEQKTSLNKALLFVVSELDRIRQNQSFQELALIQLLLKKFARKINIDALRRVFAFFKSKFDIPDASEETAKSIENLISFMTKLCKVKDESEKQGKNQDSDDNQDDVANQMEQVNERNLMRPIRKGPQTRSSRKQNVS